MYSCVVVCIQCNAVECIPGVVMALMFSVSFMVCTCRHIDERLMQAFTMEALLPCLTTGMIWRISPPNTTVLPPNGTFCNAGSVAPMMSRKVLSTHSTAVHCDCLIPCNERCILNKAGFDGAQLDAAKQSSIVRHALAQWLHFNPQQDVHHLYCFGAKAMVAFREM